MKISLQTIALIIVSLIAVALGFVLVQSRSGSDELGSRIRNLELQTLLATQGETPSLPTPPSVQDDLDTQWQVSQHAKQIHDLTGKLTQLSSQLVRIEQSISDINIDSSLTATTEPEAPRQTREELVAESRKKIEEQQRQTLDQFYAEPIDEIWSQSTQIELEQKFASELQGGAEMTYVECHTSSCEARWRLNEGLSDEKKFEFDNSVLVEMAKTGFDRIVYLESLGGGEYRAILQKSATQSNTR